MRHAKLRGILALALVAGAAAWGGAATVYGQGMGGMMGGGFGMGGGMIGGGGGFGGGYGIGSGMRGGNDTGYEPGSGTGSRDARSYDTRDYDRLDLSEAQRAKIDAIEQRSTRERAKLEDALRDEQDRLQAFYASGNQDEATARRIYASLSDTRSKLFEASLDTRRRIDAVLTREQRNELAHARAGNQFSLEAGGARWGHREAPPSAQR